MLTSWLEYSSTWPRTWRRSVEQTKVWISELGRECDPSRRLTTAGLGSVTTSVAGAKLLSAQDDRRVGCEPHQEELVEAHGDGDAEVQSQAEGEDDHQRGPGEDEG